MAGARTITVTPHVAQNINEHRGPNIDAQATRHPAHSASQAIRKRIEEANCRIKTVAGIEWVHADRHGTPDSARAFTGERPP